MKLSFLSFVLLSTMSFGANAGEAPHNGYLIKLKKPVSTRSLSTLSSLGVQVSNTIPELNIVVAASTPDQAKRIQAQPSLVEYIEPNYFRHAFALAKDIYQKNQDALWGMKSINAAEAWRISTGNPNIIVAVSDTGISQQHFELQKNLYKNPGEVGLDKNGKDKSKNKIDDDGNGFVDDVYGWNFETNNNDPGDTHFHGTHVSGTIGARGDDKSNVTGVIWDAKLMSVKFIGSDGSGEDAGAIASIIYAANNGAKVINCSWGGEEYSQTMYDAIEYAKSKGTMVVAAAGNDGVNLDKTKMYPAAFTNENLITVAAAHNGAKMELAAFSNFSATFTHLAAPGDGIYSTFNPAYPTLSCESRWFCTLSGTSMAAPHVSGAVALLYSINPKLTIKQVKEILMSTVTKSEKLAGKVASGGLLNIGAAAKAAQALVR